MPDFPTTIDAIGADFLSSALGHEITDVAVEPIGIPGTLSSGARLRLTSPDTAAPTAVFAKCPHPAEEIRAVGTQTGMYVKEVRFYQTLARTSELPIPGCYVAEYDDASGAFLLLLEDMTESRVGNLFASDLADVTRVVDELPAFHASWWNDVRLEAQPWLWRLDQPPVVEAFQAALQGTAPATIERFGIDGAFRATAELVAAELPRFARLWNDRPVTLVHGDLHLQQVFFPADRDGVEAGRFALFDWQAAMIASPGADLARLLATNLSPELRQIHERALATRYHAGLIAAGIRDYSPDDCWQDYRLGQVWNLVMVLNSGSVAAPEMVDRAARASGSSAAEFLRRTGAALADLEVAALLE